MDQMSWTPTLALDAGPGTLVSRIARAVVHDIQRGRLAPGARLPGSRGLAAALGVHRNTVLAAISALEAEGWVTTEPARGVFVVEDLPIDAPIPFGEGPAQATVIALPPPPPWTLRPAPPPDAICLLGGLPDLSEAPTALLARAWRRAAGRGRATLGYGDPRGEPTARAALAGMLRDLRGLSITGDDLLITRGSQMGLYLTARATLRPGDRVAVEALGYRPAWAALEATGAVLVPIPVDADGLDVPALLDTHAAAPLRAVYLTPHHQYPTTTTLSAARRLALLDWAASAGAFIVEDDYDNEFHYAGQPVLPLASADRAGVVIYLGTLSKVFAPSLRLGFVSARPAVLDAMVRWRAVIDRQGDRLGELAMAELLEDGELPRHVRRMKRRYRERRAALIECLQVRLPELDFTPPAGGMAIWARLPPGRSGQQVADAARQAGIVVQPGIEFAFDGADVPAIRIGFAGHPPEILAAAIARLARAVRGG